MAVGLICGIVGAGGGMMMLLVLTSVLGYELKTAVGTQRFYYGFYRPYRGREPLCHWRRYYRLVNLVDVCSFHACVCPAHSRFANKASAKTMNRALGFGLTIMSLAMIVVNFL